MKITYLAASSRDGFIAGDDGDVSWLEAFNSGESDAYLKSFFDRVDGLIMGRSTYDFVFDYGSWPYENKPAWIFTSRELSPLPGAEIIPVEEIDDMLRFTTERRLTHLWLVGGGKLASSFLDRGLISNLSITEMPIDLTSGIPLFANHSLENLDYQSRDVIEQTQGVRRLEITIQ